MYKRNSHNTKVQYVKAEKHVNRVFFLPDIISNDFAEQSKKYLTK